jgi:hypothetical protein
MVQVQAQTLAYVDAYWLLAALAAVTAALSFVLKRGRAGSEGAVAG